VQKKHIKTAQMLIFTIVFTLTVIGAASAADNSSTNLTATNVDQATQHTTQTTNHAITSNDIADNQTTNAQTTTNQAKSTDNISTNTSNSDKTLNDPQIWNGGAPVSRGGQIPTYNWITIQNAINNAQPGDTIMLENGVTFSGAGNTEITISKNLNFNVLNGGTATIDGSGNRWGFNIAPGYTVTFNNIIFQNMAIFGNGGAILNRGTLTLNNCVFTNNRAAGILIIGEGGAIWNNGNLALNNCQIYNNRADYHGSGIYTTGAGTVNIANSIIRDNVNGDGIGIYINSGNPIITGNDIYGNYWRGIYVNGGNAIISNNNIYNNGHATRNGDGIWINSGNASITMNNIYNNAEDGIHVNGGNPAIHFNRIVGNGEYGLHVYNSGSNVDAINNWWGHNTAQTQGPAIGSDYYNEYGTSTVDPWLILGIRANPYSIYNGDTSTVTAYLNHNSNCEDVSTLGHVKDGIPISFSFTGPPLGTLSINPANTVNGVATTIFTSNTMGISHVNALLDSAFTHVSSDDEQIPCDITIYGKANVVMTKTSNSPVNVGQTGIYTITLTNNGPDAAQNIQVTDPLPDGFSLGSFSAGNYDGTVWTIPTLNSGAKATLTFTKVMTTADIGTTKTNTATQTQDTYNPNPIPPQTATIYTNKAVLSITKTTNQANYNVGDSVVYNIDVLNNGPDTATNVGVTDTVANGLTYMSSTLGGIYNSATRTITWNLASLANGAHFMPSSTATVNALTQGQTITNIAFTNNSQNPIPVESTPVNIHVNNAVLTITKTANQSNYNVGDTAVYNIDVLNNGPDTATNVILTDTLPEGLTYVSSTLDGVYQSTTRTITWTVGNLVNGAHFITSVKATVTAAAGGKHLINTAQAKNDQIITPVKTTANIYVPAAALEITKTVNNKTPKIGDTVIYTLIVKNHGPDTANSVKVADVVTTGGLKFVGVDSINYGTYDPSTGVWSIDNLPANAVASLVLRFKTERAGIVINQAKVNALTFDPNLYPTEASVTINVQNPPSTTPTVGATTVTMQHTGLPIGALILAVIMLFTGIVIPKMKN
jgi:uncharacterized repeat protein (TIGR01451 family)